MKSCNQCGKCCIKYGDAGLSVTAAEIAHWQHFFPETYQYVDNGEIWIDPATGRSLRQCPWLVDTGTSKRYTCSIYDHRPDDCRQYPVLLEDMIKDACEMLEQKDINRPLQGQQTLDRLMSGSRD